MSGWGNKDNVIVTIKGTNPTAHLANLNTIAGSATVTNCKANATEFLSNIEALNYIELNGLKYQVKSVAGAAGGGGAGDFETITLTDPIAAGQGGNVKAYIQQGPKYISNALTIGGDTSANNFTIRRVFGISNAEANVSFNRNRGVKQVGWTHFFEYLNDKANPRFKVESLVALSKNFAATNDLPGGIPGFQLYFTADPSNGTGVTPAITPGADGQTGNASGANVVLTGNAASIPEGANVSYRWYRANTILGFFPQAYLPVNANDDFVLTTPGNILLIRNVSNADFALFKLEATAADSLGDIGKSNSGATLVLDLG